MNVLLKRICQPFIENPFFCQPLRTTYVLKRKHQAPLQKAGKMGRLRRRFQVYETIADNTDKPEKLTVLLHKYVEDVGRPGDVVSIKETAARYLILTKGAEYATPESVAAVGKTVQPDELNYSSLYVGFTVRNLSQFILNISMNKDQPWALEPWHIKSAFRKAHVHVADGTFTMPAEPITGPNMDLEGKEFYITVTINKTEKVPVRCRIHHWTTSPKDRLPPVRDHWKFPAEIIFPHDNELAKTLPEIVPPEFSDDDGAKFLKNRKKRNG